MSKVETLKGPMDTSELGFTLMHEHIFAHSEGLIENFPTIWDKETRVADAQKKLRELAGLGIRTIVDQTILGLGRNIPLMLEVARDLPLNVIVATGVYYFDELPGFFQHSDVEVMVDLFVRDIREGIQGTKVKAGIVKTVTDAPGVTPGVEKALRAAARTHRRTGVPLCTHTDAKTRRGLDQQSLFEDEGVDLNRVMIGHCGDSDDVDYLKQLMDRGSYIDMGRFGADMLLPTATRISVAARLCKMEYAGQMVLSHDALCYATIMPWEQIMDMAPNLTFCHIQQDVIPALLKEGVREDQVYTMTVENPRKIFENSSSY